MQCGKTTIAHALLVHLKAAIDVSASRGEADSNGDCVLSTVSCLHPLDWAHPQLLPCRPTAHDVGGMGTILVVSWQLV